MRNAMLVVAILVTVPSALPAQMAVPIGVRIPSELHLATPLADSNALDRDPNYGKRLLPAIVGGFVGATTVGGMAVMAMSGCSGSTCYGNIGIIISGALLGGIVGSAYGAALPEGRGMCTRSQRFGMGLGGSFLGALVGIPVPPIMLATIPMGSIRFMRKC